MVNTPEEERQVQKKLRYIVGYMGQAPMAMKALNLSFAELEQQSYALLAAYRERYPDLTETWQKLATQMQADGYFRNAPPELFLDIKTLEAIPTKAMIKQKKQVRQSAKTGATWPKPKGAY